MKKLLPTLMIFLWFFSSLALAADDADWQPTAAVAGKYKLLLSAKSLQREGDVVNVSLRYVYPESQVFPFLNVKYDRLERRFAFQCKERKVVTLENNYYQGETKVHSVNPSASNPFQPKGQPLVPQKVEPGTLDDEALTQACNFSAAKK